MGKSPVHPVCIYVCLDFSGRFAHISGDLLSPRVGVPDLAYLGFFSIPELPELGPADSGVLYPTA